MKRKLLEKAVGLFDTIPGTSYVDSYISSLYKEEIEELKDFLHFVGKDIDKLYKANFGEEFVNTFTKEYIVQLNEIHQCKFTFYFENETDMSINDDCYTDIKMQFRTYEKSTWVEKFNITGEGKNGGISYEEFADWKILLEFIILKKKDIASNKPSEAKQIVDKIEEVEIKMIDLNDK